MDNFLIQVFQRFQLPVRVRAAMAINIAQGSLDLENQDWNSLLLSVLMVNHMLLCPKELILRQFSFILLKVLEKQKNLVYLEVIEGIWYRKFQRLQKKRLIWLMEMNREQ